MIPKELLDRINALARKSRLEGLDECEQAEQQALRKVYLAAFKSRMQDVLENTIIEEPDGTRHKLPRKE
jgi:uncharacterized protein YnzC (UPF0291/DUF896 family)